MEAGSLTLPHKPSAALRTSSHAPAPAARGPFNNTVVVFLNGLGLPRAFWLPAAEKLLAQRQQANLPIPALLCYDRYGQGESPADPADKPDTPYGHDSSAVVEDLHQLIEVACRDSLGVDAANARLVLVGNSIGCAFARLYAAAHPGRVEGVLLLDSMIANTDFVSVFPDPDAPDFDESKLLPGLTVDDVRQARTMAGKVFHPTVPNGEKLDRRNMAQLLPYADEPALPSGPDGKPPLLVVVGHDPEEFAEQSANGPMKANKLVTDGYLNSAWAAYNAGLGKLSESSEVKIAPKCGHFVQKDDPQFVATELSNLLDNIVKVRNA